MSNSAFFSLGSLLCLMSVRSVWEIPPRRSLLERCLSADFFVGWMVDGRWTGEGGWGKNEVCVYTRRVYLFLMF